MFHTLNTTALSQWLCACVSRARSFASHHNATLIAEGSHYAKIHRFNWKISTALFFFPLNSWHSIRILALADLQKITFCCYQLLYNLKYSINATIILFEKHSYKPDCRKCMLLFFLLTSKKFNIYLLFMKLKISKQYSLNLVNQ